ncbi:bifunctional diguanylate cyclase/phosphodiesterase [Pseudorhodoferax soli]|uniref:Diguanylate cyclase (GGDEF)-like protein n=1 Tax=Pseudorhodoferax soli TaxID=545864 RepID=A0A368Y7R6_9BURK|nr:EAL domain-containing protein [Pseudorhodoferax soli]RCW75448.1 diguanylate cyclase (GGDEF)-like protein [Pseudorhodoferax soli]
MTTPSPSEPDRRTAPQAAGLWLRPALAAGLTSAALALVPWLYVQHRHSDTELALRALVAHEADSAVSNVQTQLRSFELVMRGVKGFFEGSDEVDAAEFRAFVDSLALQRTAPGLQGVGFVAHLRGAAVPRHAAAAAFDASGLVLRPPGQREAYAPILFMEPPTRNNRSALGLDVLTVPMARAAVEQSIATGALALTGKLQLVQDVGGGPEPGFVMYLPVYMPQAHGPGQEPQSLGPVGWADAPFRLRDLLAPVAADLMPGLHLQVFDGEQASEANHLFGLLDGQPAPFDGAPATAFAVHRVASFGGRNWTYVLTPTAAFIAQHSASDHRGLALTGLLLSLSAGVIVFLLLNARNRAQRLALQMSGEARALSVEIAGTLNAIPDLLVEMDGEGRYLALRARRLDGLIAPPEQIIGRTAHDLLPPAAAATVLQALALARDHGRSAGLRLEVEIKGQPRWFELSVACKTEHADPAQARFIVLSRDITSRMRILQALQENERVLLEAQRVAALGHFRVDRSDRACHLSPACARLLGLPPTERLAFDRFLACVDARQRQRVESLCLGEAAPVALEYEFRLAQGDGAVPRWLLLSTPGATEDGAERFFTLQDISSRRTSQEQLHRLAYYDQLTGLPNRSLFVKEATQLLAAAQARGMVGAAILLDLDRFKAINDNWGHRSGDAVLREVAQRLRDCVPAEHLVARLHADEFIVLLDALGDDEEEAQRLAQDRCRSVLRMLAVPSQVGGRELYCSASMGIAVFGREALTLEELLARADSAMELAKHDGRSTFRLFDEGLRNSVAERAQLEAALRQAVPRNELRLLYQPQIDADDALVGAEALCRWTHPERGPVSPAVFIALAEDSGSIYALGEWVLRTACRELAGWRPGTPLGQAVMAVNVSARQFHHPDFVSQVLDALHSTDADPARLKLELTESVVARDLDAIVNKMGALKSLGVRFSLDDFGTGYSSLSYLKRLPLDQLKIDQSFVRDLLADPNDAAIVRTVIALGASLGLDVVAEGVETAEQRAVLLAAGCHIYQGYLFAPPLPAEGLLALAGRS